MRGALAVSAAALADSTLAAPPGGVGPKPVTPATFTTNYTPRDHEVVDYQYYSVPGLDRMEFRGPRLVDVATSKDFFTCIGAAQTFGTYVQKAFPQLLSERFDLPVFNAGVGGVGAGFYLYHDRIIDFMNRGRFAIIQIMSARMEPNSRFELAPWANFVIDRKRGDAMPSHMMWERIRAEDPAAVIPLMKESQARWVANYRELAARITVPKIFLWFSPSSPDRPVADHDPAHWSATEAYPQLVDGAMVEAVCERKDLVICQSYRNGGYQLTSRFTGQPVSVEYADLGPWSMSFRESRNRYYPSPEMHEDAASTLRGPVATQLG